MIFIVSDNYEVEAETTSEALSKEPGSLVSRSARPKSINIAEAHGGIPSPKVTHASVSLAQKAKNAIGAAGRVAKSAAASLSRGESPKVRVSKEERDRRLAICQRCEFFNGRSCEKCGCIAKWKTKLATESCPVGKW